MMFPNRLVIRSNIIPRPRESTGIHPTDTSPVLLSRTDLGIRIIQSIIVYQIEIETCLKLQSLDNRSFQKGTAGNFIFHTFRLIQRQRSGQVPVCHRTGRTVRAEIIDTVSVLIQFITAVGIHLINRIKTRHGTSGSYHVTDFRVGRNRIILHGMGKTQIDTPFQPGSHFTGNVGADIETLIAGFKRNSFIIQITGREEILIGFTTTGNTQVQFRTECLLLHSIAPIGIPQRTCTLHQFAIRAHRLRILRTIRIGTASHQFGNQIFGGLRCSGRRSIIRTSGIPVTECFPIQFKILIGTDTIIITNGSIGTS